MTEPPSPSPPVDRRLGPIVGSGRTATVHSWGESEVVKLFRPGVPPDLVELEMTAASLARSQGVRTPAVAGTVHVAERTGVVFQRIAGEPLAAVLTRAPWRYRGLVTALAKLHASIHRCSGGALPSAHARLGMEVQSAGGVSHARRSELAERVHRIAPDDRLCHLDFHLSNVLVADDGLWVIDWGKALSGAPLLDIAVTALRLGGRRGSMESSPLVGPFAWLAGTVLRRTYLHALATVTELDRGAVDALVPAFEVAFDRRWQYSPTEVQRLAQRILARDGADGLERFVATTIDEGAASEYHVLKIAYTAMRRVRGVRALEYGQRALEINPEDARLAYSVARHRMQLRRKRARRLRAEAARQETNPPAGEG
ncbi:MAG: aminoglycoside phosphotransferase family protein [Ectothiorhodospiraceae bacterium]|nr:aminoglycoside phosphotransferase family protein [Ectothiorhodospiraceae bacterium]